MGIQVPATRQFADSGKRRPESLVGSGRAIEPGRTRIEDALLAIDRQLYEADAHVDGRPPNFGDDGLFDFLRVSPDARRFAIDYRLRDGWIFLNPDGDDFVHSTIAWRTIVLDAAADGVVQRVTSEETRGETFWNTGRLALLPPLDALFGTLNDDGRFKLRAARVLPSDADLYNLRRQQNRLVGFDRDIQPVPIGRDGTTQPSTQPDDGPAGVR